VALIPTALLGVGTVGVGVFPLTHPTPHTLFAVTAVLAGGIAVVLSSRVTAAPFRYLWMLLGAIALGATVLALDAFRSWAPMVELGEGGLERWIVYPILLWLVALVATCWRLRPHERRKQARVRSRTGPASTACQSRGPGHTGTFGPAVARTGSVRSA
jgi:hypothetical membrane protein